MLFKYPSQRKVDVTYELRTLNVFKICKKYLKLLYK